MSASDRSIDRIAKEIVALQLEQRRLATSTRLSNSSIENGYMTVNDADGNIRQIIGLQPDGTVTTRDQNGPPPPAPTAPLVSAGLESLSIAWDGKFLDDADRPIDFAHVEVHVSDASGYTPTDETMQGVIGGRSGLVVVAPLTPDVTYYVVLQGVNTSKVEGPISTEATGVPTAAVAGEVIDGSITTLKLADDAVTAAKVAVGAIDPTKITFDAHDIGGITTYAQELEPVGANEGDLWIATGAGGNSIRQYDGVSWSLYQFGSVALGEDSVNSAAIVAGAVAAGELAAGAVIAGKVAAGAIEAGTIAAGAVQAGNIAAGAVQAGTIAADAITGANIVGLSITADKLAANSITAGQIAAGAITASAIAADAITGKTITGGLIRTAETGARVELNASESTQDVRFVSTSDDVAVIQQTDFTDGVDVIGSGIAMLSSADTVADTQSALFLAPDTVGQTVFVASTGVNKSQIVATPTYALLQFGANNWISVDTNDITIRTADGTGNLAAVDVTKTKAEISFTPSGGTKNYVNVDHDSVGIQGPGGSIVSYGDGIQIATPNLEEYLWCDSTGTWFMQGSGDVGGVNGGILKVIDAVTPANFIELDANEIQTNPYGQRLHLNLDSQSGVTLAGNLLADKSGDPYPLLAAYNGVVSTPDLGLRFGSSAATPEMWCVGRSGSTGKPFRASNVAASSDPSIKANIEPLDTAKALTEVSSNPAYRYMNIDMPEWGFMRGVMSIDFDDDVAVRTGNEDEPDGIDIYGLVATLWAAVQEVANKVEALENG